MARRNNRLDLLKSKVYSTTPTLCDNLFVISTYQPDFPGLKPVIKKNWSFLTRSNDTKYLYDQKNKIIFCHRRSTNLRELLVRAKVQYPAKPKPIQTTPVAHNSPCTTSKWCHCPRINTSGQIISTVTQRVLCQNQSRL